MPKLETNSTLLKNMLWTILLLLVPKMKCATTVTQKYRGSDMVLMLSSIGQNSSLVYFNAAGGLILLNKSNISIPDGLLMTSLHSNEIDRLLLSSGPKTLEYKNQLYNQQVLAQINSYIVPTNAQPASRQYTRTRYIESYIFIAVNQYFIRWIVDNTQGYTTSEVSQNINMQVKDWLLLNDNTISLMSYFYQSTILLVDNTNLKVANTIAPTTCGGGYLGMVNSSTNTILHACETYLTSFEMVRTPPSVVQQAWFPYHIVALLDVKRTNLHMIASWNFVYLIDKSFNIVYTYNNSMSNADSIKNLKFVEKTGQLIIFGLGFIDALTEDNQTYCDPTCAGCQSWFSSYQCISCATYTKNVSGSCTPLNLTLPPSLGVLNNSNFIIVPIDRTNLLNMYLLVTLSLLLIAVMYCCREVIFVHYRKIFHM